jgi:hypothetical protein
MAFLTSEAVTENKLASGGELTTNVVVAQDVPGSAAVRVAGEPADGTAALGVAAEQPVWEARYSARNFLVRSTLAGLVTLGWAVCAFNVWTHRWADHSFAVKFLGFGILVIWAYLGLRIVRA